MTPMPESDNLPQRKPPALHWLGFLLLVFGATLAGAFIVRQFKESGTGHTYYEFIGSGALLAIVGIVIIARLGGR